MKKYLALSLASGLLVACGSGGGGSNPYGVFGTISASPVSQQAGLIGVLPPDAEPVDATNLRAAEVDSLNPANGVTVMATQSADREPLPLAPLPASAADPEKPNS